MPRTSFGGTALPSGLGNDVLLLSGVPAPTDGVAGTGAGVAGPGSLYFSTSVPGAYINTGTQSSPVWFPVFSHIQYVDVQLSDAQIKALPSTPIEIVAAPGAGLAYVLHAAWLLLKPTANYVVPAEDINMTLTVACGVQRLSALDDAGTLNSTPARSFIGSATAVAAYLAPELEANLNVTVVSGPWQVTDMDDQPIVLAMGADDTLPLTDGDPANTLSVRVWYSLVPTEPFGA